MRNQRRDPRSGYIVRRNRGAWAYWLSWALTLTLVGCGIAGVALGHPYTGGAALFLGGACLVGSARAFFRRRHGARLGRP